jgi:hypothetical protein
MKMRTFGFSFALALFAFAPAQAQIFTPTFMSPQQGSDLGVYLSDGPAGAGNFAVEGIWRRNLGSYDLGFRAGVADAGDAVILVGAELRTPLQLDDVPLAMAITGGIQGAIGETSAAGFQGGLAMGYTFREPNFSFTPYLHPRIGIVNGFRRDDLNLEVMADLGFDVALPQNLIIRFAFGFGRTTSDWGFGFAWR